MTLQPNTQLLSAFALSFFLLFISCEKEEDEPLSGSSPNNSSTAQNCNLRSERLINNTVPNSSIERFVEWSYEDGQRTLQRTKIPPGTDWLDSVSFSYKDGLLDSLKYYSAGSKNYSRLHIFRHDDQGRLTRVTRFDGGVRSGTELLTYTSATTGIYRTDDLDYKFYLGPNGNLIKLKLLTPRFPGQTIYFYYSLSKTKNPHYRKATYPLNISNYLNPNYIANIVSFNDSLFNHDSVIANTPIVSRIQENDREFPIESVSDTTTMLNLQRIYSYDCN